MSTTVGLQLRQAREGRSLTLEQVAQATRIRVHYLQAMEAGNFDALPSTVQARGFLRAYASFLKLDTDSLLVALGGKDVTAPPPPSSSYQIPSPESHQLDTTEADSIFAEIGQNIQHQREVLGLSLDDVERHTHLRRHYLEALEAGNMEGLPSPVQGRGMLNNYAIFLGIDPDPLLLRFADGLQARHAARQAARQREPSPPKPRRSTLPIPLPRLLHSDMLVGIASIVLLGVFVIWGALRIFAMTSDQDPAPTAPSIADVLLASPTPTTTLTPEPPTPTILQPTELFSPQVSLTYSLPGESLQPNPLEGVQINVVIHQRAWMRVIVDGEIEFEGRVIPGSAYTFVGESQIELLTGNGAGLQVIFNNSDLGLLGVFGQVVYQIYGQQGILTPTPSITPTATATLPSAPTPMGTDIPGPGEATAPALP